MAAADRWVEANALLKPYDPEFEAPKGPRVWEWTRGTTEIRLPRHWLARERGSGKHYADGLRIGAPTKDHPMQYVSAVGALYFARLMGCRLPSSAEWRAASAAHTSDAKANLRDPAWGRQQDHVRKKRADGIPAEWPDAGAFHPPDAKVGEGGDGKLASQSDDGLLWFAPVGSPDAFRHLVGNLAEFVLDEPARFDQRFKKPAALKAAAVITFLKQHAAALRVVGGSALSGPELWDGRDRPFHKPWPVDAAGSRDGYADVGFRLAFTAPRETPAERLQRILRSVGYLGALAAK
jgi:formylglycine-generating enzyme required for sulfatase activity